MKTTDDLTFHAQFLASVEAKVRLLRAVGAIFAC